MSGSEVFTPWPISGFFAAMVTVPSGPISTKAPSLPPESPCMVRGNVLSTSSSPAAVAVTWRKSRRCIRQRRLPRGGSPPGSAGRCQRQMLPDIAPSICASVGFGVAARSAAAAMICPDWQ
jgi:hypothetical protein